MGALCTITVRGATEELKLCVCACQHVGVLAELDTQPDLHFREIFHFLGIGKGRLDSQDACVVINPSER